MSNRSRASRPSLGHGQQQEETSVGTGPGNALGHVLGQILMHQVPLVTVELDGLLEVPVIVALLHVAGGHLLAEDRGAEVCGLLGHDETVDDLLRCEHPAQTETGHECLRECSEQHHSLGSHRVHGGIGLTLVAELLVGAVLDDDQVVLAGHVDDLLTPLDIHCHACRVLEVRDGVDELGLLSHCAESGYHCLGLLVIADADGTSLI